MISVIIPCLNEEKSLGTLLTQLLEQKDTSLEILVVDGGSTDKTAVCAEEYGATVIHSQRGRGCQQNAGAAKASGEHLLFLHADSRLEHNCQLSQALSLIKQAERRTAGHFRLRFETNSTRIKKRLRLFEYKTQLNREGTFNGDQGLLICTSDFKLTGGFSEKYHFLEDKEFAARFRAYGQFTTLPSILYTSARRFEQEGLEERLILNTLIMTMFHLESSYFFNRAGDAYRDNNLDGTLNLLPLFELTHQSVFHQGISEALVHCFLIGRFAAKNLWQVGLPFYIKKNKADLWLSRYDRFFKPLTDNLAGYFLATLIVLTWFYSWRFRLILKKILKNSQPNSC
jgi:rSAM/selenodomain-associated transferase 2